MKRVTIYVATKTFWTHNEGARTFPDNGLIQLPAHLEDRIGQISQSELDELLKIFKQHLNLVNFTEFGFETGYF